MRLVLGLLFSLGFLSLGLFLTTRESYHLQARANLESGKLDDTQTILEAWEPIDPFNVDLHKLYGLLHHENYLRTGDLKQLDAGELRFEKALSIDPTAAPAMYWRANAFKSAALVEGQLNYYQKAMKFMRKACELDPKLPFYYSMYFEMLIEFQKDGRFTPLDKDHTDFLNQVSYALGNYLLLKDYYRKQYLNELFTYFPSADFSRIMIPIEATPEFRKVLWEAYMKYRKERKGNS